MKLVCVKPFGNFVPGDEVEVPEDSGFDPFYFQKAEPKSTSNAKRQEK